MHIRQLDSGRWHWRVTVKGARRFGTEDTKAAAKRAALEAEYEMGRRVTERARVPLGELLDTHVEGHGYAPTTLADMRSIVRRLPDDVKAWEVCDVEAAHVEQLYRRLAREGWSGHRVRRLHTLLSAAWVRARRYKWASENVVRDVPAPEVGRTDVQPVQVAQVQALLDACPDKFALFVRLAATTGARRGELVGLQWVDVEWGTGLVTVRRSVSHTTGGMHAGAGKTGSKGHRRITVGGATWRGLRRLWLTELRRARENGLPVPVWVWSHDAGVSPWRGDYVSHQFVKARTRAGVSGVRFHDLRHYVATTLLADGVPLAVAAGRMGHSARVMADVYAHFLPGSDRQAAARMESNLA